MGDHLRQLLESAKNQNFQALAKLLSILEERGGAVFKDLPELLSPPNLSLRVGITGPPGAGKSTLVGKLLEKARKENLRVAVIAVDPSSPFTKGAILADRIRYSEHFMDSNIFIRSLGTRGSLGGLSSSAYLMLRAFDLCGFDLALIETVGVGQSELEVMYVADTISVVLVPESGDSVQAMKAGLMEIADVFVVNKGDRPGADGMSKELEASAQGADSPPKVLKTVATTGEGIDELSEVLFAGLKDREFTKSRSTPEKLQAEAKALLRFHWEEEWEKVSSKIRSPQELLRVLTSELSSQR